MAVAREFSKTVAARVARDPEFRKALLGEAIEALVEGDGQTSKALIYNYIDGAIGFANLSRDLSIDAPRLVQMFSVDGDPSLAELTMVLRRLTRHEGIGFKVEPVLERAET